ncbi:MAG: hypothetical protein J2P51_16460 [Hyphomicrobiaceae bacterium]|nr:hypothetical protein [Hyphomicrobiaceae bacterium]
MLRLNIGLVLSGLAAVAVGLLGGWAVFVGLPLQGSALAAVATASPPIAVASSVDPAATARSPAAPAIPYPAPSSRVAAPPPAPSPEAANAAASKDAIGKPHIHLDGERSAVSYEGESGGLYINKDRLSVRTPLGKFDIDW